MLPRPGNAECRRKVNLPPSSGVGTSSEKVVDATLQAQRVMAAYRFGMVSSHEAGDILLQKHRLMNAAVAEALRHPQEAPTVKKSLDTNMSEESKQVPLVKVEHSASEQHSLSPERNRKLSKRPNEPPGHPHQVRTAPGRRPRKAAQTVSPDPPAPPQEVLHTNRRRPRAEDQDAQGSSPNPFRRSLPNQTST